MRANSLHDKAHQEVSRRTREIYERDLSYKLEPGRVGEFVVVDV